MAEDVAPPVAPAAEIVAPVIPAPAEGGDAAAQKPGEQAPPATPEGDTPEVVTPEQAAKREGRRFERKLDKAYRQRAEAQARADQLEKRLRELESAAQPAAKSGVPVVDQFTDIAEYEKAVRAHEREIAIREHEERQRSELSKAAQQRLELSWEAQAEKASERYDDFDEVVGQIKPINDVLAAIMESDVGADIAYHLAKNKAEQLRIAALPMRSQVREIGKLEAKFLAKPVEPKAPSKAPAPIAPIGGKSGGASDMPLDTDDITTWMRKENARMRKLAGA